jgi:hypothetical protein
MRCVLLILAASLMPAAEWRIPDPATVNHPGDTVPAASPTSYPDAEGFRDRGALIVEGLAQEDLKKWRSGYFSGGDPGKYLPLAAMAKLLRDPADAMARQYLNDERSPREHYHFAALNWARLLPIFGSAIEDGTMQALVKAGSNFTDYHAGKGTENHKTMMLTSALVTPAFVPCERWGGLPKAELLAKQKTWLKGYVQNLYRYGQGEFDSSTYLMFCMNGMLNIYDFCPDPDARLWARAALDWFAAGYALKYSDGVYCAPNQRGHAAAPMSTISDQSGWLWWGSERSIDATGAAGFRFAMIPLTSSWRPNRVLVNLARKRIAPLPAEQRDSKPNYYFGQGIAPVANRWRETVFVDRDFTLGCLWAGNGGQCTRMQLAARADGGALTLTGGSPVGRNDGDGSIQRGKYADGNGLYDRSAQSGSTVVCLTRLPDDEPTDHAFVSIPDGIVPERHGAWWIMRVGRTWVAVQPIGAEAMIGRTDADPKSKQKPRDILRIPGRRVGFVLQVAPGTAYADAAACAAAAGPVDASAFPDSQQVGVRTREGRQFSVAWGDAAPLVQIDGVAVDQEGWPVYDGPLLRVRDGILSVSDGTDAYRIDTTGDLPVYSVVAP